MTPSGHFWPRLGIRIGGQGSGVWDEGCRCIRIGRQGLGSMYKDVETGSGTRKGSPTTSASFSRTSRFVSLVSAHRERVMYQIKNVNKSDNYYNFVDCVECLHFVILFCGVVVWCEIPRTV